MINDNKNITKKIYICFGATSSSPQWLLLALSSGITLRRAQETNWDAGDQNRVDYVQGNCPTFYTIAPAPNMIFSSLEFLPNV